MTKISATRRPAKYRMSIIVHHPIKYRHGTFTAARLGKGLPAGVSRNLQQSCGSRTILVRLVGTYASSAAIFLGSPAKRSAARFRARSQSVLFDAADPETF